MTEKAENELWLARKFAEAYNRHFRADYKVVPAERERDSADVFLKSASGGSKIGLQICMATTTERMREEAIQYRLQKELRERLSQLGYCDAWIIVNPDHAPTKNDVSLWRDGVIRLIAERFHLEGNIIEVDADESSSNGWASPFGTLPFRSMKIRKGVLKEGYKHLCIVDFLIVKDVLEVQPTIQAAINLKLGKKYSDARVLWLLIHPGEGAHTVEQVELLAANLDGLENFAQVWWAYPRRGIETEILRLGGHEPHADAHHRLPTRNF